MSLSFRPASHAERDQVVSAIQSLLSSPESDPTLLMLTSALLATPMAAYTAARASWPVKYAAARAASDAADAADADFDRDLRLLSASVRDSQGRNHPRLLAAMMGGTLASDLTRQPYREELAKGAMLLANLKSRADLGIDATRLAAFEDSLNALEVAVKADEIAGRESVAAGSAQRDTASAFDVAYARLLRGLRGYMGEASMATMLPRFVRPDEDDEPTTVRKALPTLPLEPPSGSTPA